MDLNKRMDEEIATMRDSLAATALEAAESRGQGVANATHLLYALYCDDGFAGRLLRKHGVKEEEIRRLMDETPGVPLPDGAKPVLNETLRRFLGGANDTVEVLRFVQEVDVVSTLLASHGIEKPDHQPTRAMVQVGTAVGAALARTVGCDVSRRGGTDRLAYVRLQLEGAFDGKGEKTE